MITKYSLGLLSLSLLLISCSQQEVTTPKVSVSSTPSPLIINSPISQPTASGTLSFASPTPTIYVTVKPSSAVYPSVTESVDYISMRPNLKVIVVDETGNKFNGANLKAVSLNSAIPYDSTAKSIDNFYEFTKVPTGVTIQVTASKPGYTTRIKTIVPLCSECSRFSINLNFGLMRDGSTLDPTTALSDKPEVSSISPNFNSTEINPATSFILKFSEPMDKNSVENNFIIRNKDDYIFSNKSSFGGRFKDIYNINHYNASWNSANDEVTFTPKKGTYIPTDTDSGKIPGYYVTFLDVVKDSTGISSRTLNTQSDGIEPFDIYKGDGPFKVTSVFKTGSPFSILPDTTAPKIENLSIVDNTSIKIQFSENMALYPLSIFKPFYDSNLSVPQTYTIKVDKNGDNLYSQDAIIGNPDQVILDANEGDSVKLSFPSLQNYKGKNLWVGVSDGVKLYDPAGNPILNEKDRYSTINVM